MLIYFAGIYIPLPRISGLAVTQCFLAMYIFSRMFEKSGLPENMYNVRLSIKIIMFQVKRPGD